MDWLEPNEYTLNSALTLAETYGLNALDALYLTAARILDADRFITCEKPQSAMFRLNGNGKTEIISLFS